MKINTLKQIIAYTLSFSLISGPLTSVHATDAATGGGGQKPPTHRPTTYHGGDDGQGSERGNSNKATAGNTTNGPRTNYRLVNGRYVWNGQPHKVLLDNSTATPSKSESPVFGAKSPDGKAVYFSGEPAAEGSRNVWSFSEGRTVNGKFVESRYYFGVMKDGRIKWTSNFQLIPNDYTKTPIASSRALVVTDGKTIDHPTQGSRRSIKNWAPSNLKKAMGWSQDRALKMKSTMKGIFSSKSSGVEQFKPQTLEELSNRNEGTGQFAVGVGAFYTVMGMVAAYELMTEYPNNPMVLDKYLENFDALHVAMMGGFLVFAYPFTRKIQGFTSGKNVIRSAPMFAAGLLAGGVGSILISMAADPDVRKCTGVSGLRKNHRFVSDLAACDAVYEKYNRENLSLMVVPVIANLMTTGALFLGAHFVINTIKLGSLMRSIPVLKNAKPGIIGLVTILISASLWGGSSKLSSLAFEIEKRTRQFLIADHAIANNPYGSTIQESETRLFRNWEDLKQRRWVDLDPAAAPSPKAKCIYSQKEGYTVCPKSTPLLGDFSGTLSRYSSLQATWRGVQLAKTYQAYQDWMNKVQDYHGQLDISATIYKELVSRLDYELKHPGLSDKDPRGFNHTAVQALEKQLMGDDPSLITPVLTEKRENTWKYVNTSKYIDYIVTAMACGPDAESRTENSVLQKTGNFMSTWVTGNTSPQEVIQKPSGRAYHFTPPRIVKKLSGTNRTVCENPLAKNVIMERISDPIAVPPQSFIVKANLFSGDKTYRNLYDYIKDNVRTSVLSGGENHLDTWWTNSIGEPIVQAETELREDYVKMLQTTYADAVFNDKYHYCEEHHNQQAFGFTTVWFKLGQNSPQSCGPANLHRLSYGVANSLRDELRLYLGLLVDLYIDANYIPSSSRRPNKEYIQGLSLDLMAIYDRLLQSTTALNNHTRGNLDGIMEQANQKHAELKAQYIDVESTNLPRPDQIVAEQLLGRIGPLFEELNTLILVLSSFDMTTAEDPEIEQILATMDEWTMTEPDANEADADPLFEGVVNADQ